MPGKNTRLLAGLPLIAYTIQAAASCRAFTDVVVSTDDAKTRQIASDCGAQAPFLRPAELGTDLALAIPTIQHAVREMEKLRGLDYDYVAMLQPTTPLRTAEDLDEALRLLMTSGADGIIGVVEAGKQHPMKIKRFEGEWLVDYETPPVENIPRQLLSPVYLVNGAIYATKRHVLMNRSTFKGDRCLGYIMPIERSVNIDTELDFILAECLLRRNRGSDIR